MFKNRNVIFFAIVIVAIIIILVLPVINSKVKEDLFQAIRDGDIQAVSEITNKHPSLVNKHLVSFPGSLLVFDTTNNTPLMEACYRDQTEIIRLLVEKGADINKMSGSSAIKFPIIEVLNNKDYETAWYFIEHGADLTVKGERDNVLTAILSPAYNEDEMQEQLKLVEYFIDNNISLELSTTLSKVYENNNIFGLAIFNKNYVVVEYLLNNNLFTANEFLENYNSQPLNFVLKQQLKSENTIENTYKMCEILITYGANKSAVDNNGKTAYDYATEIGDSQLIQLLQ